MGVRMESDSCRNQNFNRQKVDEDSDILILLVRCSNHGRDYQFCRFCYLKKSSDSTLAYEILRCHLFRFGVQIL